MRGEKKPLFKKEAHEEALHFGVISRDDDDEYPDFNDDKENLPATNIDDVTISIIEDEVDGHSPKPAKKKREPSPDTAKDRSPRDSMTGKRDREKEKVPQEKQTEHKRSPRENNFKDSAQKSADIAKGDNSQRKHHEIELQPPKDNSTKSVSHVSEKNERNDSHSQKHSENSQIGNKPREPKPDSYPANKPREPRHDEYPPRDRDSRENSLSPPEMNKPLNPVMRTGSFIKNRDSPRRQSREAGSHADSGSNSVPGSGQVRYPTGTPPGSTLSDLKKQRSEQHKFGTGLDAQVQNLFLHSLSGAGNKYSSGSSHPPQTQNKKENAQNGRNIKNNNNNNTSGQTRPPTFLSDSGPLRRFSAPTSHPVIGDDDKFKNNCCVIL